jgi:hypothetical protein
MAIKNFLLALLLMGNILFIQAQRYTLESEIVIFYKMDANSPEVRVTKGRTIPSEDVFIRIHQEEKEGTIFELRSSDHITYLCSAPNKWPGKKLKDCIISKKNKSSEEPEISFSE